MQNNAGGKMKKIVISNQKGGVGKTCLSTHIAHCAIEKNLKVLFIDNDTQGNAGFNLEDYATKVFDAIDLYTTEIDFSEIENTNFVLLKGSKSIKDLDKDNFKYMASNIKKANNVFDICLFDTPPTEGALQDFPMLVSDFILSPFELDNYSYMGFKTLISRISEIKALNKKIQFLGFVPNRVDLRNKFDREQLEAVTSNYSAYMFGAGFYVPMRSAIKVANHSKVPVWKVKNGSKAGLFLKQLSNNVFEKIGV